MLVLFLWYPTSHTLLPREVTSSVNINTIGQSTIPQSITCCFLHDTYCNTYILCCHGNTFLYIISDSVCLTVILTVQFTLVAIGMDRNGVDSSLPYNLTVLRDGLRVPPMITQKIMDDLQTLSLRESDVFVVTYPKSGTTWMQQIVKLVQRNGEDDDQRLTDLSKWVEKDGIEEVQVCNTCI